MYTHNQIASLNRFHSNSVHKLVAGVVQNGKLTTQLKKPIICVMVYLKVFLGLKEPLNVCDWLISLKKAS